MRSSLFLFGAALSLLAASLVNYRWFQWGGIALLALAWAPWRAYPANILGAVVTLYSVWRFANAAFITPAYGAESLYQPLMLLGGFAVVAVSGRTTQVHAFRAGVVLTAILVLLGLLQYFFGVWHLDQNASRAAGTFSTPNTMATAINMFLLPLSALYLMRGSARHFWLTVWLFAGLVGTGSRGGMLAFLAGLSFLAVLIGWRILSQQGRRAAILLAGWFAVGIVLSLGGLIAAQTVLGDQRAVDPSAIWLGRGTAERPELYAAALRMIFEHPIAGMGANMFFPLFEAAKSGSLWNAQYFYVHNDYLQTWLETGLLGVTLLVSLVAISLALAFNACRRAPEDPVPYACGAVLAACFAHAVVDFPLYIPYLLMLTGAYLGALAAHYGGRPLPAVVIELFSRADGRITPPIRWALAGLVLSWLAQPMVADIAVHQSIHRLAKGDAAGGLYWQTVARRFEPRMPAHYWAAGTILQHQAEAAKDPALAAQADALFLEGVGVNRYDTANLVARARFHRSHPELVENLVTRAEVLSWAERAASLRPHSLSVQVEFARTLAFAGEMGRARGLARRLLELHPDSETAKRLVVELQT